MDPIDATKIHKLEDITLNLKKIQESQEKMNFNLERISDAIEFFALFTKIWILYLLCRAFALLWWEYEFWKI